MSIAEPAWAAFERSQHGQNDPTLIGLVQSAVQRICMAESVVFDMCNDATDFASSSSDVAGRGEPALTKELVAFLKQDGGGRSAETRSHLARDGKEFVFVKLPLIARGEIVGKLALAVLNDNWNETRGSEICIELSRLVSLLVLDNRSKVDLEVDLIDMQRRVDRMTRKAETDPLTLVENKASFELKANARLSTGAGALALLVLDVDHFKTVNDIFGHQFGDDYLRSIAESLRNTFPRSTLIGRIGGDEFAALIDLPSTTRVFLNSLEKQLRACLQRNAAVLGKPELGRVSIGISIYPMQAHDYKNLFGAADAALIASKRSGRNTTTIYNGALSTFQNHRNFAEYFSRALEDGQIVANFQPIVALDSGVLTGCEVLARWHEPVKGLIMPESFEPAFHDYRMASALTTRIVNNALDQMAKSPRFASDKPPELWFNLTTFDLLNPEFVFDMQSALVRNGFGWENIVLEVTERVMLGESCGQVYRSLDEIRRRGGRVAFDDFGTGHAGLLHIKDWPVDIIKIDRSFTAGIGKCEKDQVVVEALLQIAATMGQDVVAEGIETEDQLLALQRLGCGYGQGYLFSAALSSEELTEAPGTYEICNTIPV